MPYRMADTLAGGGDEVAGYLAEQMEGVRYALDHRDETIALTRQIIGVPDDDTRPADVFDEVTKYSAIDPAMPIPMEKLSWMQDLLVKTGNLQTPNDLSTMFDDSARTKALTLVEETAGRTEYRGVQGKWDR